MGDQKFQYESLPIPTYEEATSSRPSSSQTRLGPEEPSDDAERQGLLFNHDANGEGTRNTRAYQPPTVESARTSLDLLSTSNEGSARGSTEELRRELEQMEVEDSQTTQETSRSRFSKRFTNFRKTLSSFHLPLRKYLPKFNFRLNLLNSMTGPEAQQQRCILILRIVAICLVVSIVYILFVSDIFSLGRGGIPGQMYEPESVRIYAQNHINETNIADNLRMLTNFPHVAGTEGNFVLGRWIEQSFIAADLEDVEMEQFDVYLNYPLQDGRRVAIVDPPGMEWEAKIDEDQVYTSPSREQTLVFHGHSKSGNVTGPLVYANYGSRDDFKKLKDLGIQVDGSVVLVRYYGTEGDRALKIKAAELAGAVGCIIYSDPAEDGFRKGDPWPKGRYMPKDGVQRGGVSLMSWVVGDVLSPGFASLPDEDNRLSPSDSPGLNQIPSMPIAWRDAQHLLKALKGHGKTVPKSWVGGVPAISEWWTGGEKAPKVNLMNNQDEKERQPIFNVLGRIKGVEQPDKKIIIGNHRDAWCFGAADPGSGSAVFLEIVRLFGELKSLGWRPLRTIEFASWDGEEYNLIGSTEHVENDVQSLYNDGFAYLNVDVAVSGDRLRASASPMFEALLLRVLKRVSDPKTSESLHSIWKKTNSKLEGLGAGSDYVAFQDIAGTSSMDLAFEGEPYPYHSCYDNFDWMSKAGDPGFQYHRALGQIWALLILELADRPVAPFDMVAYSNAIVKYVDDLHAYAKNQSVPIKDLKKQGKRDSDKDSNKGHVDMQSLYDTAKLFQKEAATFQHWETLWNETLHDTGGFETNLMAAKRGSHNSRMSWFDTHLLDLEEDGGVSSSSQSPFVATMFPKLLNPHLITSLSRSPTALNSNIFSTHHNSGPATRKDTSQPSETQ